MILVKDYVITEGRTMVKEDFMTLHFQSHYQSCEARSKGYPLSNVSQLHDSVHPHTIYRLWRENGVWSLDREHIRVGKMAVDNDYGLCNGCKAADFSFKFFKKKKKKTRRVAKRYRGLYGLQSHPLVVISLRLSAFRPLSPLFAFFPYFLLPFSS